MKSIIFLSVIIVLLGIVSFTFAQQATKPEVKKSVSFFKTKPLSEMTIVISGEHEKEQKVVPNKMPYGKGKLQNRVTSVDSPILQKSYGKLRGKGPILNFAGIDNVNGLIIADPNGDVSPLYYMQTVNRSFAVWDKEGSLLFGPVDNASIWEGFEGPWNNISWGGDPIFKYDQLADRWVVCAFSLNFDEDLYYEMVAVSMTSDPLGSYYCYAFQFDYFNDYPKISIWPDGYYITYNMYDGHDPDDFLYSLVSVVDREAMLAGEPEITMIQFEIPDPDTERFFPMAADLRGENIPDDEPCFIITVDNHNPSNPWELSLDVYEFQTDWQEPENSQFGIVAQFDLGTFEPFIPYGPGAPQKGSNINVMTVPLYLMYPVTYRQFNDHDAIVCCHTIWGGNIHYIKWYELRKEDAGWYLYQTGNYAPGNMHYFSPSISINGNGDIALGYTISNEDTYPCLKLTGRRAEDSLGIMSFQEIELYKGLNYANTYISLYDQNMWGDYASMMVDPVDDTTFWFTHMYTKATTGLGNWATRIFSFNLAGEPALPYADAGNDTLTCNTAFFITQGHAENYSSIMWTTSGDGNFTGNYTINATYLRGPDDLSNGQVTLTMHLTGYETGMEAADSMILYINKEPEVYAGTDVTIDTSESVMLQGEVNFSYEYFWTTPGDGSFTDSTLLDAIYTPGPGDVINGEVVLVLTAKEVNPCTGIIYDSLNLYVLPFGIEDISSKELNVTLYPNPANDNITLHAEHLTNAQLTLQIISSDGRVIFTGRFYPDDFTLDIDFDLSYLTQGVYYFLVTTDMQATTKKVVVAR
jgi:hypothetical protein